MTTLCQFMSAPTMSHWLAAKQVMRYLQGTAQHELKYGWAGGQERPLHGYSDSDWGNDPNDRRSVTGWVFMLHDGAVSWQSRKQPTVALSSVEAEYMAATQSTREAVWWRTFLAELGMPDIAPTVVYSDSQGSIALSKNPEHHSRTKHIDIQHHYVREQVAAGTVIMPHISTENMVDGHSHQGSGGRNRHNLEAGRADKGSQGSLARGVGVEVCELEAVRLVCGVCGGMSQEVRDHSAIFTPSPTITTG